MCKRGLAQAETEQLWQRAQRVFGVRLVPHAPKPGRRGPSLHDSIRLISQQLKHFSERNIDPTLERGVVLERVRRPGEVQSYLSKLGLTAHWELAGVAGKLGRVSDDGVTHYSLWEVAELACAKGGGALRVAARRAWKEMFQATRGKQQITFSSRRRLGLKDDPYAEDGEPEEREPTEQARMLGEWEGSDWDALKAERGARLITDIELAFTRNVLAAFPGLRAPAEDPGGLTYAADWQNVRPPNEGPFRRLPDQQHAAEDDAEKRGARIVAAAVAKATADPPEARHAIERLRAEYSEMRKAIGDA